MATINFSITVPDDKKEEIIDDFTDHHRYQIEITDPDDPYSEIPNPQSRAAFAKQVVINFIRNSVKAKRAEAADAVRIAAIATVDAIDIT